jgi:hypothetical protein
MGLRDALTLTLGFVAINAAPARGSDARDTLAAARSYLETWRGGRAAVVAEEQYEQTRSGRGGLPRSCFARQPSPHR